MENSIFRFFKHQIYFLLSYEMLIFVKTETGVLPTGDRRLGKVAVLDSNDGVNPNTASRLPAIGGPSVEARMGPQAGGNQAGIQAWPWLSPFANVLLTDPVGSRQVPCGPGRSCSPACSVSTRGLGSRGPRACSWPRFCRPHCFRTDFSIIAAARPRKGPGRATRQPVSRDSLACVRRTSVQVQT